MVRYGKKRNTANTEYVVMWHSLDLLIHKQIESLTSAGKVVIKTNIDIITGPELESPVTIIPGMTTAMSAGTFPCILEHLLHPARARSPTRYHALCSATRAVLVCSVLKWDRKTQTSYIYVQHDQITRPHTTTSSQKEL